ncbi:MAG TPA: hypothetical protein VM662_08760 [Sphingomonas sp.]|nr:hypothetical protein [Sphingomonas sp.]
MDDRQQKSIIGRDADAAPTETPANDTRNGTSPPLAGDLDDLDDFDEDEGFDIVFVLEPHPYGPH